MSEGKVEGGMVHDARIAAPRLHHGVTLKWGVPTWTSAASPHGAIKAVILKFTVPVEGTMTFGLEG
jgi:hypothetical protein